MRVRVPRTLAIAVTSALSLILLTVASRAQVLTQAAIEARLVKKPIYLHGAWKEDTLRFDSDGSFFGEHPTVPFTLAGMDVTGVVLSKETATLSGYRVALEFLPGGPTRVLLGEVLTVVITAPANGDYAPALDKIFADGLADLTPSLPAFWQPYAKRAFLNDGSALATSTSPPPAVLAKHPEVRYTDIARAVEYNGVVGLHISVKKDGTVSDVRIDRPIGLGLDDAAVAAAMHYTYKPAKGGSFAGPFEMDIEVNCQAKPFPN
jgi:TonB family protein